MGVTGLWRLIEPSGKPVPVETLENKVLAVDISIWLHQVVKGYQDAKGAPMPNAHLMGLFQRLCKLLYYRIKPVFVFDGAFPELKRNTIAKRQDNKTRYNSESSRIKRELALLLSKKMAIGGLLGKQLSPKKVYRPDNNDTDDLFKLPALPERKKESESESDDEDTSSGSIVDLHSIDLESESFKNLPIREKYELLLDLKETRKMNSRGRINELPKRSDTFSDFQLQRLLKRKKVQTCLEETEKEMGACGMSLKDLENLLNEEGIDTHFDCLPSKRIASSNNTRYILIENVKKTLSEAKQKTLKDSKATKPISTNDSEISENIATDDDNNQDDELRQAIQMSLQCVDEPNNSEIPSTSTKTDELEEDIQKAIKMSLDAACEPNTSMETINKTDKSWTSFVTDTYSSESDSEEQDPIDGPDFTSAKAYIMQNTDFTNKYINKLFSAKNTKESRNITQKPNLKEILEELYTEKSLIEAKLDLSSDDQCLNISNNNCNPEEFSESAADVIELNSTTDDEVQIMNTENSIISLNESLDDPTYASQGHQIQIANMNSENAIESSSSDDEFEEVTEGDGRATKPVVELILNVGTAPENDIFADVFSDVANKANTNTFKAKSTVGSPEAHKPVLSVSSVSSLTNSTLNITGKPKVINSNADHFHVDVPVSIDDKINKSQRDIEHEAQKSIESNIPNINELAPADANVIEHLVQPQCIMNINTTESETTAQTSTPEAPMSTERLNAIAEEIQEEEQELITEKNKLDRIGRNITEQMTKDAQELLQLFGIPYIVAPMEAEAQCAYLESIRLTDGTITDDSDIWLFGGQTVYKNFFNQKKHVLQFIAERIEKSYNLSRDQLILLALLVGSDYTMGLQGVGPVTALEILASFPRRKQQDTPEHETIVSGLKDFKLWVKSGKRTDNNTLKKKLRNVVVTEDFPSVRVVQAYLEPRVEKSDEKFTWGDIDLVVVSKYAKTKFGWSQNKVDEIMKPVIKRMNEKHSQKTLQDYFKKRIDFQSLDEHMSKRVKAAVHQMGPDAVPETNEKSKIIPKPRKRKTKNAPHESQTEVESKKRDAKPKTQKKNKKSESDEIANVVKVATVEDAGVSRSPIDVKVTKTERYQEVIPQRERDRQSVLQNKMKAIEVFRKTKMDRKTVTKKRAPLVPKVSAELSESDSD